MKLIKFTAIWCMSCIVMNETLKKVEQDNNTIYETIDYDYDIDEDMAKKYEVGTLLPVYILEENDKEIGRTTGEKDKDELIKIFKELGAIK